MSIRFLAYVACFMIEAGSVIGTEPPAKPAARPAVPATVAVSSSSFVVFAGDCNANPPMLFGGKLLAEMDRMAGITTRRFLYDSSTARDAVTVAVNNVKFHRPAQVKDLLIVLGMVMATGEKSVTVGVRVERETMEGGGVIRELIAEGEFVYVAVTIDPETKKSKAVPHGLSR